QAVDIFVSGLRIIPIASCIELYAKEKTRLRKIGQPLHDEFNLLIGVTAISNGLTLVTDNIKDFERLNGILIENWFDRS
ncbi:type II toxin-antitoxin system VapC family toxin, partial [Pseudoxanthomonas sp. SGD-10]